jgi:gamma-glutamyltranspeptidase/glutathione hydrolase/leukotriene-C4 hydrolase
MITTSVAYVALRTLWLNETIKEAIDARRVHHQLYPMALQYEVDFPGEYATALEAKNHTTQEFSLGQSVVIGITRADNGTIFANSDFRKQGSVAGY